MTYTKGYPDVIVGFWRGIQENGQNTDDDSIFETYKAEGEYRYLTKIKKLGGVMKAAGFSLGEIVGWSNPTGEPGFYSNITKARSGGVPIMIKGIGELLTHDKVIGRSPNRPPMYSYRVKIAESQTTGAPLTEKNGNPCDRLKENLTWLYGVEDNGRDAKSFLLNPTTDESQVSKPIVKLNRGEIYNLRFKVVDVKPGGEFGCSLEINKGKTEGSGWVFVFDNGKDRIKKGFLRLNGEYFYDKTFDVSWYKPGAFNIIVLSFCKNNELRISINNQTINRFIGTSGELAIHAIAQGLDVVFDK